MDAESRVAYLVSRPRRDRRVERVLQAIETRFAEPDLSLAKLAREQNLSTWRLCHLLADHGVEGFRLRLHAARCAEARRLLVDTPLLVKEVAARVGYRSARQLARHLERLHGQAPSRLRRLPPGETPVATDGAI